MQRKSIALYFLMTLFLPLLVEAGPPASIQLTASRPVVPMNGQTQLVATVKDSANAPVAGATVFFSYVLDQTGGNLAGGSFLTNAQGVATTTYTAAYPSARNGVVLAASVMSTSLTAQVALTVGGQGQRLRLTPSPPEVTPNYSGTMNRAPYTVTLTDAADNPVSGTVYLSAQLIAYFKGRYAKVDANGIPQGAAGVGSLVRWAPQHFMACADEDIDRNGFRDFGEDIDHNGNLSGGGFTVPSSVTLDAQGRGQFYVNYLASYASWSLIRVRLQITLGGGTLGNEQSFDLVLPLPESVATNLSQAPPAGGNIGSGDSPYGTAAFGSAIGADPACSNPG